MAASGQELPGVYPILGTMTIGAEAQVKAQEAGIMLRSFVGASCAKSPVGAMIDTARIYQQATPDGDTETTLGEIFSMSPSLLKRAHMATKVSNTVAPHFSMSRQSVIDQCNASLEKMGVEAVDLLYLHSPDIATSIDETLAGIQQLHEEGKIKAFGLSNYPAWAVVDIWYRCKSRGIILPTVYQGAYNVLTRSMEPEIVPVAREFGLKLYMYNPLAGGLLSGRYKSVEDVEASTAGRFSEQFDQAFGTNVKAGSLYKARYSKKQLFDALEIIRLSVAAEGTTPGEPTAADASTAPVTVEKSVSEVNGMRVSVHITESVAPPAPQEGALDMVGVALRWLIHHSFLSKGDGIILGASKAQQLIANLSAWRAGPLPPAVVAACEQAWELARPSCDMYFRGYGARPGGIELFVKLKGKEAEEGAKGTAGAK